jgi:two-component system, cell cycle response regulator
VAAVVAERVRQQVAQAPFMIAQREGVEVTVSVGLASLRAGTDSVEALLKRADLALYEAKNRGRNRVVANAA